MKAFLRSAAILTLLLATGNLGAEEDMMSGSGTPTASGSAAAPAAAPASAKPLSRAEEILKRFDKNSDGRIDEDERADAHDVMLQEQTAKGAALEATRRELGAFQSVALEIFDRNRDRQIDANERLDAIAFVQQCGDATLRAALVKRVDKNADGALDEAESREAQAYLEEHRGELMQEVLLKHYDANGNAQLDADEKAKIQKEFADTVRPSSDRVTPVAPARLMERFDKNTDGKLDEGEWTAMLEALKTERPPGVDVDRMLTMEAEVSRRREIRRAQQAGSTALTARFPESAAIAEIEKTDQSALQSEIERRRAARREAGSPAEARLPDATK